MSWTKCSGKAFIISQVCFVYLSVLLVKNQLHRHSEISSRMSVKYCLAHCVVCANLQGCLFFVFKADKCVMSSLFIR